MRVLLHVRAEALCLALFALGCQPDIGDPCRTPSDCSLNGNRICLTDQPGGYCSIFNCEPNRCPEEAVCVAYRSTVSPVHGCRAAQGGQRLQRTFCMKRCSSDGDCRRGYACVGYDADDPFSAMVVDRGREAAKICAVPYSGELIPEDRPGDVCGVSNSPGGPLDGGTPPASSPDSSVDGSAGPVEAGPDGTGSPDAPPEASPSPPPEAGIRDAAPG